MRYTIFFLAAVVGLFTEGCEDSNEESYYNPQELLMEREEKTQYFHLSQDSPMNNDDRNSRKPLNYYKPDSNYVVKAVLVPSPQKDTIVFQTSNDTIQKSMKLMGKLRFALNDEKRELSAYIPIRQFEEYPEGPYYLFIPFTDNTNGSTTYEAGRYLDIKLEDDYAHIIDFNKAYNPYCAYNDGFSCPIVPDINHLDTRVEAGEMKFEKSDNK